GGGDRRAGRGVRSVRGADHEPGGGSGARGSPGGRGDLMPRVRFKSPFDDVTVEVPAGTSLLEAAEQCGATVGHACGGVCACSTRHGWGKKGRPSLSGPEEAE